MAVALVGFLNGAVAAHLAVWLVGLCPVSAGTCRYQLARTGVSFPARRDWSVYWPQGAGEVRAGELCAGQVRVGQVNRIQVVLSEPAPDHGDGGQHVGPWRSLPVVAARIGWRPVLA